MFKEELLKVREKVFLEVLEKVLLEIESDNSERMQTCKRCGSILVKNGCGARKIKTLLGEVEVSRARMRCKTCKKDIYPFDDAIGLVRSKHETLGVRERSLWAATEVSYEKTSAFLKKFTGLEVSRKKIHQMALEEGRAIERFEDERRARVFDLGRDVNDPGRAPDVLCQSRLMELE